MTQAVQFYWSVGDRKVAVITEAVPAWQDSHFFAPDCDTDPLGPQVSTRVQLMASHRCWLKLAVLLRQLWLTKISLSPSRSLSSPFFRRVFFFSFVRDG